MRITGEYEKLGELDFFIPYALPPKDPPFEMSPAMIHLFR
jgi:hypothetical protein